MSFCPMLVNGKNYSITRKKEFRPYNIITSQNVKEAFDFAYDMSFGNVGKQRNFRTGGNHRKKKGECFKDTFQGKIAECALHNILSQNHHVSSPDFGRWGEGIWDDTDLTIDGMMASVKSTKSYGNLLLLETGDYDANGIYIANRNSDSHGAYNYFILVRIYPFCEVIMKKNRLLYAEDVDYNYIKDLIMKESWQCDVPGFITNNDFVEIIHQNMIIPQGSLLNGKIPIDANNYYVQAGDLRDIQTI